jgi:hypothetical protein
MYSVTMLLSQKLSALKGKLPGIGEFIYAGRIYFFMGRLLYKIQIARICLCEN